MKSGTLYEKKVHFLVKKRKGILMKFDTLTCFGPGVNAIKNGSDSTIFSSTCHTKHYFENSVKRNVVGYLVAHLSPL